MNLFFLKQIQISFVLLIKFCDESFWSSRKGHLTTELLKFIERHSIQDTKSQLDFVRFVYHNDEYS